MSEREKIEDSGRDANGSRSGNAARASLCAFYITQKTSQKRASEEMRRSMDQLGRGAEPTKMMMKGVSAGGAC